MKNKICERCKQVFPCKRDSARFCSQRCLDRAESCGVAPLFTWVYVASCKWGVDEWVKIGKTTKEPHQRVAQLQTSCPIPVKLFGFFPGSSVIESYLHNKFKPYRTEAENEWFKISPQEAWRLIWEDVSWQ